MNKKAAVVLLSGSLFACAPIPPPAPPAPPPPAPPAATAADAPQEHNIVTIRTVNCEALLELSEGDRASASMFYLGYTASRRGRGKIDIAEVSGLEAAALGYCEAFPNWPAAAAFMNAFADNGR
jgi:hypothetical protein